MNGISQRGLSNGSFRVKAKNHLGATAEDICDQNSEKSELRKKPDVVIIHAKTKDLKNNSKSLENYKTVNIKLSKFRKKNKIDKTDNKT